MAKEDEVHTMIMSELKYIRGKVDQVAGTVGSDHTRLDDHITDHRQGPDKTMAAMAIISGIIAVVAVVLSITGCAGSYDRSKALYQMKYMIPFNVPHPQIDRSPVEEAKAVLAAEAYEKVSVGVGLAVGSLILGLLFSNVVIQTLSHLGMVAGGTWTMIGLTKLFVAQYLIWLMWAAVVLACIAIVYRFRKRSITRSAQWLKSLRKTQ